MGTEKVVKRPQTLTLEFNCIVEGIRKKNQSDNIIKIFV